MAVIFREKSLGTTDISEAAIITGYQMERCFRDRLAGDYLPWASGNYLLSKGQMMEETFFNPRTRRTENAIRCQIWIKL